jgi:phosphoglycolate phosphatase
LPSAMQPNGEPRWPRAVVFDLDGTLIDSAPDIRAGINAILKPHGLPELTLRETIRLIGQGPRPLVERAFASRRQTLDRDQLHELTQRFIAAYERNPAPETQAFPGAREVITELRRGARLGICTNKPVRLASQVLARCGLESLLDGLIGSDSGFGRKPDPGPIRALLEKLEVSPGETLYVGDSEIDVTAARAAGVKVAIVSFGYADRPAEELGADAFVGDFAELPRVIHRLSAGVGVSTRPTRWSPEHSREAQTKTYPSSRAD